MAVGRAQTQQYKASTRSCPPQCADPTYGKGKIQSVFELADGSALIVTVAKYQTPAGSGESLAALCSAGDALGTACQAQLQCWGVLQLKSQLHCHRCSHHPPTRHLLSPSCLPLQRLTRLGCSPTAPAARWEATASPASP